MSNRADNFNRADATLSSSPTPSDGLSNWQIVVGNPSIKNNQLKCSGAVDHILLDSGSANVNVSLTLSTIDVNTNIYLIARCDGTTNNYVYAEYRPAYNQIWLGALEGGSAIGPGQYITTTPSSGDAIRLTINSSNVANVYYTPVGGAEILAYGPMTISNASLDTNTKHGIHFSYDVSSVVDNFSIQNLSSAINVGTLTYGSVTAVGVQMSWTAATGGTGSITSKLQQSAHGANTWSDVAGATLSPFAVTGLSPNTTYDFRVAYTDQTPQTAYSSVASVTTTAIAFVVSPSVIPSGHSGNITVSITKSGGTFTGNETLTVGGVGGVTLVSSSVNGGTSNASVILTTSVGTGALTISDGTYSCAINVATPSFSLSPSSSLINQTINVSAQGTNTIWTTESAATLFSISGGSGASISSIVVTDDSHASFQLTTGTSAGTLAITASPTKIAQSISINLPGAPGQPSNLTATATSDSEVFLTWDRADDTETSVIVERSSDNGVTFSQVATLLAHENFWRDTNLFPSSTYMWRVKCRNSVGDSAYTSTGNPSATTMSTAVFCAGENNTTLLPSASNLTATASDPWNITLSWANNSQRGWYMIDRSTDGGLTYQCVSMHTDTTSSTISFKDRYLQPGTRYTYRLRNDSGDYGAGPAVGPVSAQTPSLAAGVSSSATGLCSNTYSLAITATGGSYKLVVSNGLYAAKRFTTVSIAYNASADSIAAALTTALVLYNQDRNYNATVYVQSVSAGNYLVSFDDGSVLLTIVTDGLSGGSATITENQTALNTTLTWVDNSGGVASYKIEVATNAYLDQSTYDTIWTQVGTTSVGATHYNLTTTGEKYYLVRIRPNTASGDGGYTPHIAVRTPSAGSALNITVGSGQTYTSLGQVPWSTVGPGSTITVNYGTYNELVMIGVRGTLSKPVLIQGVLSGSNRPVLNGVGASTNSQFKSPVYDGFGVVMFLYRDLSTGLYGSSTSRGWSCGNILFKNFECTGAYRGDSGGLTCTNSAGAVVAYDYGAAGIYCGGGENIIIDNVYVHGNGNGVFGLKGGSGNDTLGDSVLIYGRNITVRNSIMQFNGNPGHPYEHEIYFETDGLLIEGCQLGPSYGGGNALKERCAMFILRYSSILGAGPAAHLMDLIEPENHRSVYMTLSDRQKEDWVYGNAIYNPPIVSSYSGTATGGTNNTITFPSNAVAIDNYYAPCTITTTGGTGSGQTRYANGYNGTTKTLSVAKAWAVNPDNTTTFSIATAGAGSQSAIHSGGDRGSFTGYKKTIRWYHNTFLLRRDNNQPDGYNSAIFIGTDNAHTTTLRTAIDIRNSAMHHIADQATAAPMCLFSSGSWAIGYILSTWATSGFTQGANTGTIGNFTNIISGSTPTFAATSSYPPDMRLSVGSSLINQGTAKLAAGITIDGQYVSTPATSSRVQVGSAPDIGAYEFNNSASMSTSTTYIERGQSFTINLTGTSVGFANGCFSAIDQNGSAVVLTSNTATDSTHGVVTGTAPNSVGYVIISDIADGAAISIPVTDTIAPTVQSITVNPNGSLTITFSETVQQVYAADYQISSTSARVLSNPTANSDSTVWNFQMNPIGYSGETYTLSYNGSRTVDTGSNPLAPFANHSIVNNSNVTADYTAPATPTGLSITPQAGALSLSWTANIEADLSYYKIYRNGVPFSVSGSRTTYNDLALVSGRQYSYTISAVDNNGNESPQSSTVYATPAYPDAPSQLSIVTNQFTPQLNWSSVAVANGPAKYRVERSSDNGISFSLLSSGLSVTSFTDTPLAKGTYIYRVTTLDAAGNATNTASTHMYVGSASASSVGSRHIHRGR